MEKCEAKEGVGFFTRDGLLYRRWIPPGRGDEEEMAVEQLVLPRQCREMVLRLAHTIPLAGHLGRDKTTRRVLQHFYWPTIHKDTAELVALVRKLLEEGSPPSDFPTLQKNSNGYCWSVT